MRSTCGRDKSSEKLRAEGKPDELYTGGLYASSRHANYFGEYTTFNPSTYYGSGSISCPETCAHYGLTARGARFVCNQYTGGSGEGCYPYNDGMYGEANCGLMVRDMVLLTENGNTEDCAGGIMGCVTGSCVEHVTWHSVECQCE